MVDNIHTLEADWRGLVVAAKVIPLPAASADSSTVTYEIEFLKLGDNVIFMHIILPHLYERKSPWSCTVKKQYCYSDTACVWEKSP